jgi:hypothetical protein
VRRTRQNRRRTQGTWHALIALHAASRCSVTVRFLSGELSALCRTRARGRVAVLRIRGLPRGADDRRAEQNLVDANALNGVDNAVMVDRTVGGSKPIS